MMILILGWEIGSCSSSDTRTIHRIEISAVKLSGSYRTCRQRLRTVPRASLPPHRSGLLGRYRAHRSSVHLGNVHQVREYGYTADQLKAATKAGAELPWGKAEEHDGGFWGGVGSFFVGIGEGFMDMVKGLGGLIGWGENGWSWSNAGHAWAGLGKFALAIGVYSNPASIIMDQVVGVPGFKRGEMGDTLLTPARA
jgi:hypothetical protein